MNLQSRDTILFLPKFGKGGKPKVYMTMPGNNGRRHVNQEDVPRFLEKGYKIVGRAGETSEQASERVGLALERDVLAVAGENADKVQEDAVADLLLLKTQRELRDIVKEEGAKPNAYNKPSLVRAIIENRAKTPGIEKAIADGKAGVIAERKRAAAAAVVAEAAEKGKEPQKAKPDSQQSKAPADDNTGNNTGDESSDESSSIHPLLGSEPTTDEMAHAAALLDAGYPGDEFERIVKLFNVSQFSDIPTGEHTEALESLLGNDAVSDIPQV